MRGRSVPLSRPRRLVGDLMHFSIGVPRVTVSDALQAHREMLKEYKDADIHNVTAYLVTLK